MSDLLGNWKADTDVGIEISGCVSLIPAGDTIEVDAIDGDKVRINMDNLNVFWEDANFLDQFTKED